MTQWNLSNLLAGLHNDIQQKLNASRSLFGHTVIKGDATENVWIELLGTYLPKRYSVERATVVDSLGNFSDQLDVVVFDRQYSPFIFTMQDQKVIPAESVYAVFEAKQSIDASQVGYAQKKVASVRRLHRTNLPINNIYGTSEPKKPPHILGGLLTFESEWSPALGEPLAKALGAGDADGTLDLGCVAAHGHFARNKDDTYAITYEGKPATAFLFELIARLQASATVPMINIRSYAKWLTD
jgi:hypothetical protein